METRLTTGYLSSIRGCKTGQRYSAVGAGWLNWEKLADGVERLWLKGGQLQYYCNPSWGEKRSPGCPTSLENLGSIADFKGVVMAVSFLSEVLYLHM